MPGVLELFGVVVLGLSGLWILGFVVTSVWVLGASLVFEDQVCRKAVIAAAFFLGLSSGGTFAVSESVRELLLDHPTAAFAMLAFIVTLELSAVLVAGRKFVNRRITQFSALAMAAGFIVPQVISFFR
jgi:hypothetical protein